MSRYVGKHEQRAGHEPEKSMLTAGIEGKDRETVPFSGHTATAILEKDVPRSYDLPAPAAPIQRKRVKKRSRFARFLLIYSACFLLLIAVGLVIFWKYIASYEASRPEHAMDALLSSKSAEDWASIWGGDLIVSEFEDKEAVFQKLFSGYFHGESYTYRKSVGEYTEDYPVYIVRSGTTDLFRVRLAPKGHDAAGFGFQLWETAEVRPLVPEAATVKILAPPDAVVSLNDHTLADTYITDDHAAYENLAEDDRFNAGAHRVVYAVHGLYDDVSVAASDESGEELAYVQDSEGAFAFEPKKHSVRVIAPADAVVSINGVAFSADNVAGAQYPPSLFDGLENFIASPVSFLIYEADGLLMAPQVEATDAAGRELESYDADGFTSFGFADDEAMRAEHLDRITDFVHAYVNFTTNMGDQSQGNFTALSKYMLSGTDMYWRLASLIEGIHYVSGLNVTYRQIDAYDFASCGENCFVCRLSFSLALNSYAGTRDMDSSYDMVFVKSGGKWLAAAMSAI